MKITVFCGSSFGNKEEYKLAARKLGNWIGENHHTLVYGGGDAGIMGEVAKATKDSNGEVIGVVPGDVGFIKDRPQIYVDNLIVTKNMSERKHKMFEIGDAFIALPGGIGTLDEISETITLTKIGVSHKPSIFFNLNGYYNPIKTMLEEMTDSGFLNESYKEFVLFSDDLNKIEEFIK